MPYGSYWHSCDVLPEGRRPRGHSHNCANNSHMVTREAQATTNLLPVPGKVRLSKLPNPQPAHCTLFPWIQLSVPHGIYWHTSYSVLRVCYFTPRATRLSKLPKPQPARCTLFPWIQLSVPHGIYWHTSYGVLRVCYFTLRATI